MLFKKLLKILDNYQESTQGGTLFWNKDWLKLHAATTFIKKNISCECWETFNTYFTVFMDE